MAKAKKPKVKKIPMTKVALGKLLADMITVIGSLNDKQKMLAEGMDKINDGINMLSFQQGQMAGMITKLEDTVNEGAVAQAGYDRLIDAVMKYQERDHRGLAKLACKVLEHAQTMAQKIDKIPTLS